MLKQEKLDNILETVNTKGTITVKEIMTRLDVSDMTARRYLQELADKDLLVRVHGGAEKIRTGSILNNERSNIEKQSLQIAEKQEISRFAGHLIDEGETIFIGIVEGDALRFTFLFTKGRNRIVFNTITANEGFRKLKISQVLQG